MGAKNAIKSALWSFLWTFTAAVLLLSVGWLSDVAKWASTNGRAPLPGLSVIGYAVVGALVGAGSGLISFVVRLAQAHGKLPGTPPEYPTKGGDA